MRLLTNGHRTSVTKPDLYTKMTTTLEGCSKLLKYSRRGCRKAGHLQGSRKLFRQKSLQFRLRQLSERSDTLGGGGGCRICRKVVVGRTRDTRFSDCGGIRRSPSRSNLFTGAAERRTRYVPGGTIVLICSWCSKIPSGCHLHLLSARPSAAVALHRTPCTPLQRLPEVTRL